MYKLSTLSFLLVFSVFSSAGQELAEHNTINKEQITFDITDNKMSDADILQSLDKVVNQLDSEISLLEEKITTQDLTHTKNAMVSTIEKDAINSAINTVNEEDNFNNSLLFNEKEMLDDKAYEDDMDLFDSFDELTLEDTEFDESLYTNEFSNKFSNEPSDKQILKTFSHQKGVNNLPTSVKTLSDNLSTSFDNTPLQNKTMTSQGVGISGDDEQTINNLDNSDLMDYIKESDLWTEDMLEDDIEIEFHD